MKQKVRKHPSNRLKFVFIGMHDICIVVPVGLLKYFSDLRNSLSAQVDT